MSLNGMPNQSQTKDTTLTKIFVGGLPYHTTDESLRKFFEQFGSIEEAVVITDRQTGKSRGYGFVTMARSDEALMAIRDPNPCIDGRKANVNLAVLGAKPRQLPGSTPSMYNPINPGLSIGNGSLYNPASLLTLNASNMGANPNASALSGLLPQGGASGLTGSNGLYPSNISNQASGNAQAGIYDYLTLLMQAQAAAGAPNQAQNFAQSSLSNTPQLGQYYAQLLANMNNANAGGNFDHTSINLAAYQQHLNNSSSSSNAATQQSNSNTGTAASSNGVDASLMSAFTNGTGPAGQLLTPQSGFARTQTATPTNLYSHLGSATGNAAGQNSADGQLLHISVAGGAGGSANGFPIQQQTELT